MTTLLQIFPETVQYYVGHPREYFWLVYFPIMAWMILVLIFLVALFLKYTFGNWSVENPNPYEKETFGMPRGTFRGILTLTLLWVVVVLELVNVRVEGFEAQMHELMIAFQMMIGFYFGSKVMHHITAVEKSKASYEYGYMPPDQTGTGITPAPPGAEEEEEQGAVG